MIGLVLFIVFAAIGFAVFKYAIPSLKGGTGASGSKPDNSVTKSRE